ncbi:ddx-19 [Pristionchus pacificus]|uniref:RNA helicase n=1 Tax=Pristionchus pacificus TaxID=54126 RepID=A0A2A6B8J9_PRIPA|nr:ddx-19 [Pristionchus pacificus]|eukprot:PDM62198.1 ddx-19 [Pristionchus pacificus]
MGDSWGAAFIEQERKEGGPVERLAAQTTTLNLSSPTPFVNNNAFGAAGRTSQSPVITYGGPKMEPSGTPPTPARKTPEPIVDKPMSAEEIALLNKFLHKTVNLMQNESVNISAKQLDPSSPLYSMHTFEEMRLREPLLKACADLGFHQPSRIQEFALPLLLMEPKLVDDLFEQYFSNGKKLRPDEAEKRMRERNDILPAQRMTFDQIRNRITTLLSQKKEHQRKEHGNKQRRHVKLIDDFERDLAEEGISLDDIEEEVDLERPLDEDDLIITSDEIYDLVHSNKKNPSEPVFSDFGELEHPTNMIAQSQSGTGKTAAFLLSMLSRVVVDDKFPQCICLAPTYELAMQIGEVVSKLTKFMPEITIHYAVKGVKVTRGQKLTDQFVIGTPGKMLDYVTKLNMFDISKVICLVLDEADVMMSQQGHQDLTIRIYAEIERASPSVQTLLFSATYDQTVMEFANKIVKNAVSVTLSKKEQTLPNIKQYYVECLNREAKYEAVVNLYSGLTIASAIIFCHTRQSATWVADRMKEKGHEVGVLHGDLSVEDRAKSIQQFKDGVFKVLVTTNVCARGIDVSQVTVVINYDPPVHFNNLLEPDYETYLHRIGRTGRFGKAGIAINFVDSRDSLYIVKKIEAHFEKEITKLDPSDMEQLEAIDKD